MKYKGRHSGLSQNLARHSHRDGKEAMVNPLSCLSSLGLKAMQLLFTQHNEDQGPICAASGQ